MQDVRKMAKIAQDKDQLMGMLGGQLDKSKEQLAMVFQLEMDAK